MSKVKKNLIIIIFLIIIGFGLYFVLGPIFFFIGLFMPYEDTNPISYTYIGWESDKFKITSEEIVSFPDVGYRHDIYSQRSTEKKLILEIKNESNQVSIKKLYKDTEITCYVVNDYLLYKRIGEENLKFVTYTKAKYYQEEYKFLTPCLATFK